MFPNELLCDFQKEGTQFKLICYRKKNELYACRKSKAIKVVLAELSENLVKIDHLCFLNMSADIFPTFR